MMNMLKRLLKSKEGYAEPLLVWFALIILIILFPIMKFVL